MNILRTLSREEGMIDHEHIDLLFGKVDRSKERRMARRFLAPSPSHFFIPIYFLALEAKNDPVNSSSSRNQDEFRACLDVSRAVGNTRSILCIIIFASHETPRQCDS
mmetsp:Transcript_3432/g.6354  ORF Transcript_3432/g.6354 Transcript_3432/m.6354 type:complete len:107 (-) Transcript_3432:645-965(-)